MSKKGRVRVWSSRADCFFNSASMAESKIFDCFSRAIAGSVHSCDESAGLTGSASRKQPPELKATETRRAQERKRGLGPGVKDPRIRIMRIVEHYFINEITIGRIVIGDCVGAPPTVHTVDPYPIIKIAS